MGVVFILSDCRYSGKGLAHGACVRGVIDVCLGMRGSLQTLLITVAETGAFARAADRIWSEQERTDLVDYLAHNPEAGDLIVGTGGVRKLRWGRSGADKRGGARVVYFNYSPNCPLYLLLA
jgi:hypothetical protein